MDNRITKLMPDRAFSQNSSLWNIKSYSAYKSIFYTQSVKQLNETYLKKLQIESIQLLRLPATDPLLQSFNRCLTEFNTADDGLISIDNTLKTFEEAVVTKKQLKNISAADLSAKVEGLIAQWKLLGEYFGGLTKENIGISAQAIRPALQALSDNIVQIETLMYAESDGIIDLSALKTSQGKSFLNSIVGIINALKGFEFEDKATKFLIDKLISNQEERITIANLGDVRYNIQLGTDRNVNIKEDLAVFDKIYESKMLTLMNGEQISLKELIVRANQSEQIVLTAESYKDLQDMMLAGISAKSSSGKKAHLQALSVPRALNMMEEHGGFDTNCWILKHLFDLYTYHSSFRPDTHKDYTMIMNYIISKNISLLIGRKNTYFLTRKGLVNTYEYLFNYLKENDKLPIVGTATHLNSGTTVQMII